MDQKGMKFIEHGNVRFQTVHKEIAGFIVGDIFRYKPVPEENAFCIGIYNK
jgi:hypothetical protein